MAQEETTTAPEEEIVEEEDELKEEVVCEEGAPGWVVTFWRHDELAFNFLHSSFIFCNLGPSAIR